MTLNKKLANLRKKQGLSQAEVSEKLSVSRQAVSRWEAGDSKPSTENLQALCKLYSVSLIYLLDENEEEPLVAPPPTDIGVTPISVHEHQENRKTKNRILIVLSIILVLCTCCVLYFAANKTEADKLNLHDLQQEEIISSDMPDFSIAPK